MLKLKAMTELTSSERGEGVNTTELELESAVGPGWEGTRALKHIMIHSLYGASLSCAPRSRAKT